MEVLALQKEFSPADFHSAIIPIISSGNLSTERARLSPEAKDAVATLDVPVDTLDHTYVDFERGVSIMVETYSKSLGCIHRLSEYQKQKEIPQRIRNALDWFFENFRRSRDSSLLAEDKPRVFIMINPILSSETAGLVQIGADESGKPMFALFIYAQISSKLVMRCKQWL